MIHAPLPAVTAAVTTTAMLSAAVIARAATALRVRVAASLRVLHARPEAGYSSEATVVTSLLVGAAAVVFGTIFWPDLVSLAKSVFTNITHP